MNHNSNNIFKIIELYFIREKIIIQFKKIKLQILNNYNFKTN